MMRLSFRGRLIVMITSVLVIGGGLLLVAQYLVLSLLLNRERTTVHEVAESAVSGNLSPFPEEDPGVIASSLQYGPTWMHEDPVVASVLRSVQMWSALLLLTFVALAIVGAWLVTRSAMSRIAQVTDATTTITEYDLSRRLNLQGPDDEFTRLGKAIDGMIDRLESAFIRQQAFIANASHEFRTPLATARIALQVAVRQKRVPPELMPEIEDVLDANGRLEDLVGALLTIAQGRAGADLPTSEVDVAALLREVIGRNMPLATAYGVRVDAELPETARWVSGSEPLLHSMVTNLVVNGLRHNLDGGFLRVGIGLGPAGGQLEFENTGTVLAADAVSRLTEAFYRGDRSRLRDDDGSQAGAGLGLTLVQSIVELHGGGLYLLPRVEGGLVATVTLPQSPEPAVISR